MAVEHYYTELAAAYVRGKRPDLAQLEGDALLQAGARAGLRLHRFKRTGGLPRVHKVIGALHGFAPARVVDVGSGRGVFLWPLVDALPATEVTAVDLLAHRVADIHAVHVGGIERLTAAQMSVNQLGLGDDSAAIVTVLEVLEHLEDPASAAREVVRVARRAVIASVPSKPDDNQSHVRLFDRDSLTQLFMDAGASAVGVEYVLNHIVAVVRT